MYINQFYGNQNIKAVLSTALSSNSLVHGILLCAQEGMGVNHFARLLAADILNADSLNAVLENQHPSLQVITGDGAQNIIKVDKIRRINDNVNFSSMSGEKRVIIIENCENFNQNSANALLKNLEEPKDDITYILTTNSAQKILPTIRSRCGVYTLNFPDRADVEKYFRDKRADMSTVSQLVNIYGDNIGKIQNAMSDKKRYDILSARLAVQNAILQKDAYTVAKHMFSYNKDRDGIKLLMQDLTTICHNSLSRQSIQVIQLIEKYTEILSFNTNLNLVIENFATEATK